MLFYLKPMTSMCLAGGVLKKDPSIFTAPNHHSRKVLHEPHNYNHDAPSMHLVGRFQRAFCRG